MELRRDLFLGVGALVGFHLLVSFGAIGLLSRMSPAIERILEDNVYSIDAAERMLAVLAQGQPVKDDEREAFRQALADARRNITERDEILAIERVEANWVRALGGDTDAVGVTVAAVREVVTINRDAMRRADEEAQRLGTAGAWTVVFIALAGFGVSLLVMRRMRRHILNPLFELYQTLESARRGDRFRRCQATEAPSELRRALEDVNELLEEREELEAREIPPTDARARGIALHLLDERLEPTFVVDGSGALVMANAHALEILGGSEGQKVRTALRDAASSRGAGELRATAIEPHNLWLCTMPGEGAEIA